jgi:hypothetical protein
MHVEEYREYWDWRESLTDMDLVDASGMTIAEAAEWHQALAFAAKTSDPLENFRRLMRHAGNDERDRLKDNALHAHSLYDSAEILRRHLDRYHQYPLPDETDID